MDNEYHKDKSIGKVMGTRETSSTEFWLQVKEDSYIEVDDIVTVKSNIEGLGSVYFFGVVREVYRGYEGIEFDSWNKNVSEGIVPVESFHIAKVSITNVYNSEGKEVYLPPKPGDDVFVVRGEEATRKALNMSGKKELLPCGILNNGEPAYINWEFINGTKGAHISISGISGVATKTSYSLFLIHSMFYSKTLSDSEKRKISVIIFNVKAEDLMYIDHPIDEDKIFTGNTKEEEKKQNKAMFEKLGIEAKPFDRDRVKFFAPPIEVDDEVPLSERKENISVFRWGIKEFFEQRLLEFLFDPNDMNENFRYVLDFFLTKMEMFARESPSDRIEIPVDEYTFTVKYLHNDNIEIVDLENIESKKRIDVSLKQLLDKVMIARKEDKESVWWKLRQKLFPGGEGVSSTIAKLIRRFSNISKDISNLVGPEDKGGIKWENGKVNVVYISDKYLSEYAQKLVVGSIIRDVYERKKKTKGGYVFIMLDELNKYAPAFGETPLKDYLIEIAERGRSLGIILIGAQQMSSEVEPRIISNCSVKIIGRVDPGELESKVYRSFPPDFRERSKRIKSGTMIISQPDLEIPIVVRFPKPPYATSEANKKEIDDLSNYRISF